MNEGPLVLVVDDDAGTREAVRFLLEDEGYVVETAENGNAALTRLRDLARKPALLLLDLMMPGMDGEALLGHLERTEPVVPPIVLMTAAGPGPGTSNLQYPILRKPFGVDALMAVVTTYCPRLWDDDEPATDETSVIRTRSPLLSDATPFDGCSRCDKRAASRCTSCGEAFCKVCLDAGPDGRCARCFRAVEMRSR